MTSCHSALHPVRTRALDHCIEQEATGIEVFVNMHVQGQPALLGKFEQQIQKTQRLLGILRDTADRISTRSNRLYKPLSGGIEPTRSVPRQVRHDLQGHSLAAVLAKPNHGFEGAKSTVGFDVRMVANSHGPMGETNVEGAFGACHDVLARRCGGKLAIRPRGTLERSRRIFDQASRARLVEVLMRIYQARNDKLVSEIDRSLRVLVRDLPIHRDNTAVSADCDIERLRHRRTGSQHPTLLQNNCYAGQYRSLKRYCELPSRQLLYTSSAERYNAFVTIACHRGSCP